MLQFVAATVGEPSALIDLLTARSDWRVLVPAPAAGQPMPDNPDPRQALAQQGRLWLLSLVCATVGALTVWRTGSLGTGILAFLATVAVLGPILWSYEKSRRHRRDR